MQQTLDNGKVVYFGLALRRAEELLSLQATDHPLPGKPKGGNKALDLGDVYLCFDNGRLRDIEFRYPYQFTNSPAPYPEHWKNFMPIGEKKIHGNIFRDELLEYLAAWEKRAAALGVEKMALGDLSSCQYSISFERNQFRDMIHISMGPSRRTAGQGIWCDGWTLFFAVESDFEAHGEERGLLKSLTAFRDEFNTAAR
jgi:hypothetical protein